MGSKILILGGSGLLGYHCQLVFESGFETISTWNSKPMDGGNKIHLDALSQASELKAILQEFKPDAVINTIALVTVDGCEADPELAEKLNSKFVRLLVDSLAQVGLESSHLVQISSDSVYGRRERKTDRPWSEDDMLNPLSVYARTKMMGEYEAEKHRGPVVIIRTAFYGLNPYSTKSLLWWIIDKARKGEPIDGWENIFFSPISALKLSQTIKTMIKQSISGVFNVGSDDSCNKFDFVDAVCTHVGIPATINRIHNVSVAKETIRPENSVLDCSKLSNLIPWDLNWRDNLMDYIKTMSSDINKLIHQTEG